MYLDNKEEITTIVKYDPMDSICNSMNNLNLINHINVKLIRDLDVITNEVLKKDISNVDIYDVCVSCGCDLTWDQDYNITSLDIEWLKNDGFLRFKASFDTKYDSTQTFYYNMCILIFRRILELFLTTLQ